MTSLNGLRDMFGTSLSAGCGQRWRTVATALRPALGPTRYRPDLGALIAFKARPPMTDCTSPTYILHRAAVSTPTYARRVHRDPPRCKKCMPFTQPAGPPAPFLTRWTDAADPPPLWLLH